MPQLLSLEIAELLFSCVRKCVVRTIHFVSNRGCPFGFLLSNCFFKFLAFICDKLIELSGFFIKGLVEGFDKGLDLLVSIILVSV